MFVVDVGVLCLLFAIVFILNVINGMKKTVKCNSCGKVGLHTGCTCTYKCPNCKAIGNVTISK